MSLALDPNVNTDASDEDSTSTLRQPSLGAGEEYDSHGDYSSQMQELFDSGEDGSDTQEDILKDDDDDEDGFVYSGMDAVDTPVSYHDRLRDVLGPEHEEDDSDTHEVEKSLLLLSDEDEHLVFSDDEILPKDVISDHSASVSSQTHSSSMTPPRIASPDTGGVSPKMARPFLHPTISRLRSYTPHVPRVPSASSVGTQRSQLLDGLSPSPSHFSSMSRTSSVSNLRRAAHIDSANNDDQSKREVFKWTRLRNIESHVYQVSPQKASSILGSPPAGFPTALAANGLICIGTDQGNICVYDFKQTLKCICGKDTLGITVGPVTAIALSHDHTYVASGHASGHIQLFDLRNPQAPARSVPPTTLTAVSSGRQEGHLTGSRIVSIGFVAGRHTALVSADEHGLAFYHSLGKVLFVEASDVLRILGKYPEDEPSLPIFKTPPPSRRTQNHSKPTIPAHRRKTRYTILAMMPLPLGTSPHPTDVYNVVALLTPTKLVVVGLKPTPKTWFKSRRESNGQEKSTSKIRGTMAWFPSVLSVSHKGEKGGTQDSISIPPTLAYTWGRNLHLIRVFESRVNQPARSSRTGKVRNVDVSSIIYEDAGGWSAEDEILAIQWLNVNQVVLLTPVALNVYDTRISKLIEHTRFDGLSLLSPFFSLVTNGAIQDVNSVGDVAHSFRVYKGKLFLLGREQFRVGTLLTWADRILSFVEDGDFLSAIELTRSYYIGEAPGNRNGLPDNLQLRQEVIGEKLYELMMASARYAFSEDRMTDGTHNTPDGRGVDRTSLFEGLVATCARASIALNDYEFLFEDLFQQYDDAAITRIFLLQLEAFVVDGEIAHVPPHITQRLVALHEEDGRPDLIERIIWHIDPACLDINQAIHLCQKYRLYDALIYVYTRGLGDYVAPLVELLSLIRKAQQFRNSRSGLNGVASKEDKELIIINSYKIYPYLANILGGLIYPSEEPLGEEEALKARKDVYTFLFFGRSSIWPFDEGGKLVLTAEEEGGVEPTYPYARLLLRFDSEAFLHSLDIAFEDPYLNDESQGISRHVIIQILLEILSSGSLPMADVTFVNIFIARNVPKYPQFLQIPPSTLHNILIGLSEDSDDNTREDRQLATEYLLSVYNPHESERILRLFEKAGFFRILRSWHRHERQWAPLVSTYLLDPDLLPSDIFTNIDDVLDMSTRLNKGILPLEVMSTISEALPRLLHSSVTNAATLIDKHAPDLHHRALAALDEDADYKRYIYLRHLLGPRPEHDEYTILTPSSHPSFKVANDLRHLYISLQCRYQPTEVVAVLKSFPLDFLDWAQVLDICETNEIFDAVVWACNWRGDPQGALSKAETFEKRLTLKIVDSLSSRDVAAEGIHGAVSALLAIGRTSAAICFEHSQNPSVTQVPLEDIWFQLLSSQIHCVQHVSGICISKASFPEASALPNERLIDLEQDTISLLRSLVQETFSSLVSISSTRAVSFPRLFKRLVNPVGHVATGTQYTEFRTILTGMLESYRSEGDMLVITKHLVDRDLFETVAEVTRERAKGWGPIRGTCSVCQEPLMNYSKKRGELPVDNVESREIVVSRTGVIYHSRCSSTV